MYVAQHLISASPYVGVSVSVCCVFMYMCVCLRNQQIHMICAECNDYGAHVHDTMPLLLTLSNLGGRRSFQP